MVAASKSGGHPADRARAIAAITARDEAQPNISAIALRSRACLVEVPTSQVYDWDTFHGTFAQTSGFPDFDGRNMNAEPDSRNQKTYPAT